MANKIYIVDLTDDERAMLLKLIQSGKRSSRKVMRAQILLLADEGKTDQDIAKSLHTSPATVQRTRQRFVEGNLEGAINERPRPGARKKLDGKGQATLIALSQSQPPPGRKRWTLDLLSDRLVALQVVDEISSETVRKELKKNASNWM